MISPERRKPKKHRVAAAHSMVPSPPLGPFSHTSLSFNKRSGVIGCRGFILFFIACVLFTPLSTALVLACPQILGRPSLPLPASGACLTGMLLLRCVPDHHLLVMQHSDIGAVRRQVRGGYDCVDKMHCNVSWLICSSSLWNQLRLVQCKTPQLCPAPRHPVWFLE